MKSFYDNNNRYTKESIEIYSKFAKQLRIAFKELLDEGYSPREISHMITSVSGEIESCAVLGFLDRITP